MIKKILAFSSAAVVAIFSLASAAMAEDDNTNDVQSEQKWDSVTVELTADFTPRQIRELLQYDNGVDLSAENSWNADIINDSGNSYSNIILAPWSAETIASNGGAWINGSEVPFEFLGGTVSVDLKGVLKDYYLIREGTTVVFVPVGINGGPAGYAIDSGGNIIGVDNTNTIKGGYPRDYQRELAISEKAAWQPVNNTVSGYVCTPVVVNASFGLSTTTTLDTIDFENSSIKVAFSVEMSKEKWNEIVPPDIGVSWSWDKWDWNNSDLLNNEEVHKAVSKAFGVVGESGTFSDGSYTRIAGSNEIMPVRVTKYEENSSTDPADLLKYKELSDGTLEVSGIRSRDFTEIVIPETVNGKKVTSIGYRAFYECSGLTSVTIPESIVNIEEGAFDRCMDLKNANYTGTGEQWKNISIGTNNDPLLNAAVKFGGIGSSVEVNVTIKAPENVDISGQTVKVSGGGVNVTITITDGVIDVSGVANGTYTFTFSAKNCAPRAYKDIAVANGTATGLDKVELNLYGDINGDGNVTLGDVLKANAAARNSKQLTGYEKDVADINGDGNISLGDVLKMNAHARNSKSLW